MDTERHVLVVLPHPDDESFGVAGTVAFHVKNGTPVTYACLTLGEMGRNMGYPPFANRETLPQIRKKELQEVARILGIKDLRLMGLRDKTIEFEDEDRLTDMIFSVIEELNPSLVITFYPGYSVHPDHEACGAAVVRAVARRLPSERPKLHGIAFSKNCVDELGEADIVHDVKPYKKQKLAALKAHRSQTHFMLEELLDKAARGDEEAINMLYVERFWTYQWPSTD